MRQADSRRLGTADAGTRSNTTRTVVQHRYGPPDVLELTRVPTPTPGPGEVLVRVAAASINARDWHVMRGEPRIARLLDRGSFGLRRPRVATRGTDLAGTVEAIGDDVTRWQVGDRVFGEGTATLADHAVAKADQLASIPMTVGFDEAAAMPLAATTALLCLEAAAPAPGASILVNGGSGGVGTFAIQLAKAMRLHVTAVVSPRNMALASSLGADRLIDYTTEDFTLAGREYDLVVDLVGNRGLRELRRVVGPGGALVLCGGGVSGEGRVLGPLRLLVWGQAYGRVRGLRILTPQATPSTSVLQRLADLACTGQLTSVIERHVRLEEAAEGIRSMETHHAIGKLVVVTA